MSTLTQNEDAPEQTASATPDVPPTPPATKLNVRPDLYDESYSPEQYQQMMAMYEGTLQHIEEGEIVKSKVLRVTDNAVILDVGFKSEGAVPIEEFKDAKLLKEGDEIEVFLENLEDNEGAVVLSKKKADFMRVWEKIRVALRERRAGRGHAGQEDQGRRRGGPDGRGRVPARVPDRAAPGAQHRRAARPGLPVQDHQAQQAPPQHRRLAPRDPRGRARDQARAADEGAGGRAGAEGRGQEHHGLRRLHRPRRRGRPAPHHRHVLRPRLAPQRDGQVRPGARGQDPRHRLGARAHLARPQAAPAVPVGQRGRQVPGRHARPGQGRLDHQLRRLRRAGAGDRGAGPHLRDVVDPQRAAPVQDRLHRRDHRGGGAQGGRRRRRRSRSA